jgi:hypothetical protein
MASENLTTDAGLAFECVPTPQTPLDVKGSGLYPIARP